MQTRTTRRVSSRTASAHSVTRDGVTSHHAAVDLRPASAIATVYCARCSRRVARGGALWIASRTGDTTAAFDVLHCPCRVLVSL